MNIEVVKKTARSIIVKIIDGGYYYTKNEYDVKVNGKFLFITDRVITPIFSLLPESEYCLEIGGEKIEFKTDKEFVTLCVRDFGAKGDGKQDDTIFIQAAIMSCPKDSRVLIPQGDYLISNIFLKSNVKIELHKNARIIMNKERYSHPVLPGLTESWDEKGEYNLGTWEGNPLDMFAACITGINVKNVEIYGEGEIYGNASYDSWWNNPKEKEGAWRPRLLFLNGCENISVSGVTFRNSPSWNVHPYFSKNIEFIAIRIDNPKDSPNTDGIDVESCKNVTISGVRFTLGDDCIALKACKIYMAKKYKVPSENIVVENCFMERGHGAVTIGSEMSGGVKKVRVSDCCFQNTDRGLRIKSRRGRGELAVVDDVSFKNIDMNNVETPFVANSFYHCDPDGHSDYVQSRESLPVDERTPYIKSLEFENISCENAHVAAAYLAGLPEKKIDKVIMKDVRISFGSKSRTGMAAMLDGVPQMSRNGIFASNIQHLILENVVVENHKGDMLTVENVDKVEKR